MSMQSRDRLGLLFGSILDDLLEIVYEYRERGESKDHVKKVEAVLPPHTHSPCTMRPLLQRTLPRIPRRLVFARYAHSVVPKLTSPTSEDVAHFASFLAPNSIISTLGEKASSSGEGELEQYNADWMGKYRGKSRIVLRPKTTQEVSSILKHCWERRIGVVPQGGNTGLVGE